MGRAELDGKIVRNEALLEALTDHVKELSKSIGKVIDEHDKRLDAHDRMIAKAAGYGTVAGAALMWIGDFVVRIALAMTDGPKPPSH